VPLGVRSLATGFRIGLLPVSQEVEKFGGTAADRRLVYADAIEVQR
jgi:hypothetical protein